MVRWKMETRDRIGTKKLKKIRGERSSFFADKNGHNKKQTDKEILDIKRIGIRFSIIARHELF